MRWDSLGYKKVKHFSPEEFSESPVHCRPSVIYDLDYTREKLNEKIYPSPVKGALARFKGKTSRHYAGDRFSDAIDFFVEGYPIRNLMMIVLTGKWRGIGVYLDTNGIDGKPWVMFHVDKREKPLFWFRNKTYFYPEHNTKSLELFRNSLLYKPKYME